MSTITSVSTRVTCSTILATPDPPPKLAGELHRVADIIPVRPRAYEPVGLQNLQHLPAGLGLVRARRRARRGGTGHGLLGLQLIELLFDALAVGPLFLGIILVQPRPPRVSGPDLR